MKSSGWWYLFALVILRALTGELFRSVAAVDKSGADLTIWLIQLIVSFPAINLNCKHMVKTICSACNSRVKLPLCTREFIREQAVVLRFGCLCPPTHVYWPIARIAVALRKHESTIRKLLTTYTSNSFIIPTDKKRKARPLKVSRSMLEQVTSKKMLQSHAALPLRQRVQLIKRKFKVQIAHVTLRSYYLKKGIKFMKVDTFSTRKISE